MTDTSCRVSIDELEYDFRNQDDDTDKKLEAVVQAAIYEIRTGGKVRIAFNSSACLEDVIAEVNPDSLSVAIVKDIDGDSSYLKELMDRHIESFVRDIEDDIYAQYKDKVYIKPDNTYGVEL